MNMHNASSTNPISVQDKTCYYFHFNLIVTGKGERKHLPKLFKSLMATETCSFQVIRFIGQRSPITSEKRKNKYEMVGTRKAIPNKDQDEIGLPARKHLQDDPCQLVILIDDLEHDRRQNAQEVFNRYRRAFDTILTDSQKTRASVHFLVNMLEAYYFADVQSLNSVLSLNPSLEDYKDDVEDIRHPKAEILKLYPHFHESDDGGKILDVLDVEHVLSRSDTCAWLRTLFVWCIKALKDHPSYESFSFFNKFQFFDGKLSEITSSQLEQF